MNRPTRYMVKGTKVLDQVDNAPPHVQEAFLELLELVTRDPYGTAIGVSIAPMRGVALAHTFVAWNDMVRITYRIAQDQPVILLVGVHWFGPPEGPEDPERLEGWGFPLAA